MVKPYPNLIWPRQSVSQFGEYIGVVVTHFEIVGEALETVTVSVHPVRSYESGIIKIHEYGLGCRALKQLSGDFHGAAEIDTTRQSGVAVVSVVVGVQGLIDADGFFK